MSKYHTQEEFIEKNKIVEAISNDIYKGSHIKIKYVCKNCQKEFLVTPFQIWRTNHCVCRPCSIIIRAKNCAFTQYEFIQNNQAVGAISYAVYKGVIAKISYICTLCGKSYKIEPHGVWTRKCTTCPSCGYNCGAKRNTLSQETFNKNNSDIGAVSYAVYKGWTIKINYVCTLCGKTFLVSPSGVWSSSKQINCQDCGKSKRVQQHTLTQKEFQDKNIAVKAFSYAMYKGVFTKIPYICINCGKPHMCDPHTIWKNKQTKCGNCQLMRNGIITSRPSLMLCSMIPPLFQHNYVCRHIRIKNKRRRVCIDWAGIYNGYKIAIEYDEWFWHGHKQKEDYKRVKKLIKDGWKVLRIKARNNTPTKDQIDKALSVLTTTSKNYYIIRLKNWGKGKTFSDYHLKKSKSRL